MSEDAIIKQIGAVKIKNSGRGRWFKGDCTWHNFLVDIKESGKSFTLNRAVWQKVCMDAVTHRDKDPMLLVVLGGQTRLAVVEFDVLEELVKRNDG